MEQTGMNDYRSGLSIFKLMEAPAANTKYEGIGTRLCHYNRNSSGEHPVCDKVVLAVETLKGEEV
jgi:hypothetical protein